MNNTEYVKKLGIKLTDDNSINNSKINAFLFCSLNQNFVPLHLYL